MARAPDADRGPVAGAPTEGLNSPTEPATNNTAGVRQGGGILAHLDAVFGDQTGWVFIGVGAGQHLTESGKVAHEHWAERSFRWPAQADKIMDEISSAMADGADVYFTPSLSENPVREKAKNPKHGRKPRPVYTLWTDLDDNYNRVRLSQLRSHGGCWLVASGSAPDRLHLYVPLVEPAAPAAAEDLLRRLAGYLGADPAPAWHGAYLCPVGTKNWKPTVLTGETPGEVRFEVEPCEAVWTVDELDDLLPPVEHTSPSGEVPGAEPVDMLPAELREVLDEKVTVDMDRSKRTIAAVGACVRAGLSDGQVITAMRGHAPTIDKYDGRADEEVARALAKVHTEAAKASRPDVWPPPSDPMAVARQFLPGDGTLRYWRGGWMRWQPLGQWVEIERTAVSTEVYETLEDAVYPKENELAPWQPSRRKVGDVLDALGACTFLPETVDAPAWLDRDDAPPAGEIVAVANGLLHIATRTIVNHDPRFFTRVAVPFAYEPDATAERWLRFLDELWPNDPDAVAALQEFFGYVVSGRTDLHKILLLIGPTRAGKGVIARVLTAMVGKGNVAGPTLASLGTNFGLSPLLGKPLAIVSDARLGDGNAHQVVERLLSISGEDFITVDRKYREPWTGKVPARFFVISNELPNFGDASGAIANRFVVLELGQSWLGRENTQLTDELLTELPGILGWALDGLDRLTSTDRFTTVRSSEDATMALQDIVSPTAAFVRDRCVRGPHEVPVNDLFFAWKSWCEENGQDRPGTVQKFGRDLRAVIPGLKVARPNDAGRRHRSFLGLALSTPHIGQDRGPTRTTSTNGDDPDTDGGPVRDGPRSQPLSPQLDAEPDLHVCRFAAGTFLCINDPCLNPNCKTRGM
jgi:putative DNA primase/helicase